MYLIPFVEMVGSGIHIPYGICDDVSGSHESGFGVFDGKDISSDLDKTISRVRRDMFDMYARNGITGRCTGDDAIDKTCDSLCDQAAKLDTKHALSIHLVREAYRCMICSRFYRPHPYTESVMTEGARYTGLNVGDTQEFLLLALDALGQTNSQQTKYATVLESISESKASQHMKRKAAGRLVRLGADGDLRIDVFSGFRPLTVAGLGVTIPTVRSSVTTTQAAMNEGDMVWIDVVNEIVPNGAEIELRGESCHHVIDESVSSNTQRGLFIDACRAFDKAVGFKVRPARYELAFTYGTAHIFGGDNVERLFTAAIWNLVYRHPLSNSGISSSMTAGVGVSMNEVMYIVKRLPVASDSGQWPKASQGVFKFVSTRAFYMLLPVLQIVTENVGVSTMWGVLLQYVEKAERAKQKSELHFYIFYIADQLAARSHLFRLHVTFTPAVRRLFVVYEALMVDNIDKKVDTASISRAFSDGVSIPNGVFRLVSMPGPEGVILNCGLPYDIMERLIAAFCYRRIGHIVKSIVLEYTHPSSVSVTVGCILFAVIQTAGLSLSSSVWGLIGRELVRLKIPSFSGGVRSADYFGHALLELIYSTIALSQTTIDNVADMYIYIPGGGKTHTLYILPGSLSVILALPGSTYPGFVQTPVQFTVSAFSIGSQVADAILFSPRADIPPELIDSICGCDPSEMTENTFIQAFSLYREGESVLMGMAISCVLSKRVPVYADVKQDVAFSCSGIVRELSRPPITEKQTLVVGVTARAGVVDMQTSYGNFRVTVWLPIPVLDESGNMYVYPVAIVFLRSDKYIRIICSERVLLTAMMGNIDPSKSLDCRRKELSDWMYVHAESGCFSYELVPPCGAILDTVPFNEVVEASAAYAYANIVRSLSIVGLFRKLLKPQAIASASVTHAVIETDQMFSAVFGIDMSYGQDVDLCGMAKQLQSDKSVLLAQKAIGTEALRRANSVYITMKAEYVYRLEQLHLVKTITDGSGADNIDIKAKYTKLLDLKQELSIQCRRVSVQM